MFIYSFQCVIVHFYVHLKKIGKMQLFVRAAQKIAVLNIIRLYCKKFFEIFLFFLFHFLLIKMTIHIQLVNYRQKKYFLTSNIYISIELKMLEVLTRFLKPHCITGFLIV